MIDTAFVEQRMRDVNPVSGVDDINPEELSRAVAATHTRRATAMQAPTQPQTTPLPPTTPPPLRRRNPWAFAAAFILILATIGIAALLMRGDTTGVADEPPDRISVDSLNWSRVTLRSDELGIPTEDFLFWTPTSLMAEGGPGLVAIAGLTPRSLDGSVVWTSLDGYAWSQVLAENDSVGILDSDGAGIAGREDLLVAVGDNHAWTSSDGVTWTMAPEGAFGQDVALHGVITGGPGFVAFGEDELSHRAAIWTSPNGHMWTRVPDDPAAFSAAIHAMTLGGPGLVAMGSDQASCTPVVWTSPDGIGWTRLPYDPTAFGADSGCGNYAGGRVRIRDVSTGGPGLVAVGSYMEKAAVWTSPDGVAWTRVPYDSEVFDPVTWLSEITRVAAVGDGLVAIGHRSVQKEAVWTSHDGLVWTDIMDNLDPSRNEREVHLIMMDVFAGGPGVIILGEAREPDEGLLTVLWIGSPSEPPG
jgi:hypothetical protein